ncbi:alpha/beta hydrolase [Larkinella soli]|uniref:alpha/beta hydrolase n=1 Tax=Larkinella soli TaxID=1770527 RepID=UPI000FFC3FFD|nr:alpha/beta hydrolase [Larkinella soli]
MNKRNLLNFVLLTFYLCACEKPSTSPKPSYPGKKIDIGGYQLHYILQNPSADNRPAVVMDAGLGGISLDWHLVQQALGTELTTLSYDRSGMGWSDAGPYPGNLEQNVLELHTLLDRLHLKKPILLVGHSSGALRVLAYARKYPDEIYGVVLVDPTVETNQAKVTQYLSESEQQAIERAGGVPTDPTKEELNAFRQQVASLDKMGKLKETLKQQEVGRSVRDFLPADLAKQYEEVSYAARSIYTLLDELEQTPTAVKQVYDHPFPMGKKPIVILSATQMQNFASDGPPAGIPTEIVPLIIKLKNRTQKELVSYSTHPASQQVIIENAGHYIQIDKVDEVAKGIKSILGL